MALSAFDRKSAPPSPPALKAALGKTAPHWSALVSAVAAAHPPIAEEWAFAGAKYGWSLRLKRKERVVLYLIPQEKGFLAGLVLGENAARAASGESGISAAVLALLEAAPRYAEGRGLRFPVTTRQDVESVLRLVALKLAP